MIVSKVISCHTDEKYTLFEVEHPTLSVKGDNFHSEKKDRLTHRTCQYLSSFDIVKLWPFTITI